MEANGPSEARVVSVHPQGRIPVYDHPLPSAEGASGERRKRELGDLVICINTYIYLSIYLAIYLSIYLSIYLYMFIHVHLHISIHIYIYIYTHI